MTADARHPLAAAAAESWSADERRRQLADDSLARRTVCMLLIAIVATGAVSMAFAVAAIALL